MILVIAALFVFTAITVVRRFDSDWNWMIVIARLTAISAITFSVSLLNWIMTKISTPTILPKIDFSKEIPADARTVVIIPTMFSILETVREMFNRLEVHYLANQDENLYFAILSDFADADTEKIPADEPLLNFAKAELAALN